MSALPVDVATAQALASKHFCAVGGINLPTQTVVAGAAADLDALETEFAELNPRKRFVRLKTEGAFHTYYMVEAARRFRAKLDATDMAEPEIKVLSNYTGAFHDSDPAKIKAGLFFQLFHPVNWIGCLQTALTDGVNTFVEFGGGIGTGGTPGEMRPNLEGMIKKATRGAEQDVRYFPAINLETLQSTAAAGP